MNITPLSFVTVMFWILTAAVVFLRPRYGALAYILLLEFDFTGSANFSDASVGWENGIKALLLPAILLIRIWPIEPLAPRFKWFKRLWLVFVTYAAVAVLWSPYKLSAVKMIGYFGTSTLLFLIFVEGSRRRWLTGGFLIFLTWSSIFLAVVQTFFLGNAFGDPEYEARFTGFLGAQSFAPFLVCMFALLVLTPRPTLSRWITAAAALAALVGTGSRSNFLGFAWTALIVSIALATRYRKDISLLVVARNLLIGALLVGLIGVSVIANLRKNRIHELLSLSSSQYSLEDIGTIGWRVTIWTKALAELSGRGAEELLVGSGTSSSATVALQTGYFEEENLDPNRCMHDEFLRVTYEWGLVGLTLFLLFLGETFRLCLKMIKQTRSPYAWALLSVAGILGIGLLIENILAGGASPIGAGYCIVFAAMAAQFRTVPYPHSTLQKSLEFRPLGSAANPT